MSEIPDDIIRKSRDVAIYISGGSIRDNSRLIADAILEERERCANLAYEVCASTRHVTLGTQCADVIMGKILVKEWREE